MTKPVTLEEYAEVGPEFFAKFNYVKTQLPADTSVEDTLSIICLLYTSPSPRDRTRSRMPSSA